MHPLPQLGRAKPSQQPSTEPSIQTHMKSHVKSHAEPFAYEYVLEEGKLPFLTELHPSNKTSARSSISASPTAPMPHIVSTMKRSKSLKRKEKHANFDVTAREVSFPVAEPPPEKTTDKLKRALSLSGIKSNHFRSFSTSYTRDNNTALPRSASTRTAGPPPNLPRPPTLVLPTPSPSPDPEKAINSASTRSSLKTINFSLPRSSWASSSEEDQLDLAFMRESAHGRLTPSPIPRFEGRRDKAMAVLGLSEFPITPPYTPAVSTAPSIHEQNAHSRQNSRRTSVENNSKRLSQAKAEEPIKSHPTEIVEKRALPLPKRVSPPPRPLISTVPQTQNDEITEVATGRPPPPLRRKTSKFIEHIDLATQQIPAQVAAAPASAGGARQPLVQQQQQLTRGMTVPTIPITSPRDALVASLPRRSESMKVPRSPRRSIWGAELCTAEARPIVAVGSARLIQS